MDETWEVNGSAKGGQVGEQEDENCLDGDRGGLNEN